MFATVGAMPQREVEDFISHWSAASPSERANSQPFLTDLCDLLEVPRPDPHPANGYFFEFPVTEHHPNGTTSIGRIDLYRRSRFVLESKQFQEAKDERLKVIMLTDRDASGSEIPLAEVDPFTFHASSNRIGG